MKNNFLLLLALLGFISSAFASDEKKPESTGIFTNDNINNRNVIREARIRTMPIMNSLAVPGTIQVENFVTKNGDVRAQNTPGTTGGQNLGFIRNGNYTEYNIDVATAGTYVFNAFVSSNGVGGNVVASIGDTNLGSIIVPVNNNWHEYTSRRTNIVLPAGPQRLRLRYTGANGFLFNIDRVRLTLLPPPAVADCSIAPTGLVFSSSSTSSLTFTFDNTNNDTRTFELRVYEKGTFTGSINNGGVIAFGAASARSTTISASSNNLQPGTEYDVVFRALCNPGGSPFALSSGTTDGDPSPPPPNGCTADFEERNGLVVIEAENLDISGTTWTRETSRSGFTGTGYIRCNTNSFGVPGGNALTTTIRINSPGKYRFRWRNAIGVNINVPNPPTRGTDENDSWMRFDDASDFYGERPNGERTFPRGRGVPVPRGAGGDGWFKVYTNNVPWNFDTTTGDSSDGRPVFVEFDSPGDYTFEISARSRGHLIDRVVLYKVPDVRQGTALSLAASETTCSGASAKVTNTVANVSMYPNPTTNGVTVSIDTINIGAEINVYNLNGQLIITTTASSNDTYIDLSNQINGLYIINLVKDETILNSSKVVKN